MPIDIPTARSALLGRDARLHEAPRYAAVATILRERNNGPEVLLIRRSQHDADPWSGHMAFPGGRHDAEDPSLLDTAVRETSEEIGLDLVRHASLLGRMDDVPAVARGRRLGLTIAPFVFELEQEPPLRPDPREVSEVIWAPLCPMAAGELDTRYLYMLEGEALQLPAFDVHGRIVWGLTYNMLTALFGLLGER